MADPTIPVERKDEPQQPWSRKHGKLLGYCGFAVCIFLFAKFCGGNTARQKAVVQQQQTAALDQQANEATQLKQLRDLLQAERDNNERLRAQANPKGTGQHVAPCQKPQVGQTKPQDDYGGPLVCVQERDGTFWEPIQGTEQSSAAADYAGVTPAQLAQLQAQAAHGASNSSPASDTASRPKPKPKAPDYAVSFRDDSDTTAAAPQPVQATPVSAQVQNSEPAKQESEDAKHDLAASVGEKYRIRQGTLLPCTEMLRINGALPGHINCLIAIPIYSTSGTHLLIPQYSLALGTVEKVTSQNTERLFVAFDRIIEPDGYTITFQNSDGLDQIGQTGLRDKVDHHYPRMFGTSLAIAAVGGLSQIGAYSTGVVYSPFMQYRAGVTENLSESSMQILNRFSTVLPTFVIREGARNNLYLPNNLWVPDYSNHAMKGDM
jgi:type IV secretory pathway VirB10-like protein